MSAPLIEVRGAGFKFGQEAVFGDLDLDVYSGEVLTILGPNGCGKSTLLRCIGGVLALDQGAVRLENIDLSTLDVRARARKIALLFQDHTPSFPFPVLDVVSMGRTPYMSAFGAPAAQDLAIAEEALEQVGMSHLKTRPYTELSGGERQLVLLARTLAQRPAVILLDEPTAHLDFKNQVRSLQQIGALAERGVTMIMTTHDPNQAFLFPGRAALMQPGGSLAVGPPSEVITDESLSAAYGLGVAVLSIERGDRLGELKFCTPWYNWPHKK
ncbi:MAG TPA: ABC transporter ATP-binding protein [Steroidobacteraceae bacterium]|jgi:iron complex transport system ATP-binding protein|nr:ABC transporter ATP-binding protein [Steroidobacteraceae bacterium]